MFCNVVLPRGPIVTELTAEGVSPQVRHNVFLVVPAAVTDMLTLAALVEGVIVPVRVLHKRPHILGGELALLTAIVSIEAVEHVEVSGELQESVLDAIIADIAPDKGVSVANAVPLEAGEVVGDEAAHVTWEGW